MASTTSVVAAVADVCVVAISTTAYTIHTIVNKHVNRRIEIELGELNNKRVFSCKGCSI